MPDAVPHRPVDSGATIHADDVRGALLPAVGTKRVQILDRSLGNGFDLPELLAKVARHYLRRALDDAGGNKTRAARLVGLPSYQTFTNWMRRHGVED